MGIIAWKNMLTFPGTITFTKGRWRIIWSVRRFMIMNVMAPGSSMLNAKTIIRISLRIDSSYFDPSSNAFVAAFLGSYLVIFFSIFKKLMFNSWPRVLLLNMLANSGLISTTKVSWTSSREIEIGLVKFNWIVILSKSYLVAFQVKSILLLSKKSSSKRSLPPSRYIEILDSLTFVRFTGSISVYSQFGYVSSISS